MKHALQWVWPRNPQPRATLVPHARIANIAFDNTTEEKVYDRRVFARAQTVRTPWVALAPNTYPPHLTLRMALNREH
jgi:hypothetical protein